MTAPFDWQCDLCGAPGRGPAPEPGRRCRLCPPAGAAWRGAFGVAGYFDLSARLVHLFKYERRREAGEAMAAMMIERLRAPLDPLAERLALVVPVPIHWRRRVWRGFNQSRPLAAALAGMLALPCETSILLRRRHTQRQALLPRERRGENVRGAFTIPPGRAFSVEGKGVLLVDDVVTSGATVDECARVLREAGAREVWVACFARAGLWRAAEEEWVDGPDPTDDWLA
jgi:ComF family protein